MPTPRLQMPGNRLVRSRVFSNEKGRYGDPANKGGRRDQKCFSSLGHCARRGCFCLVRSTFRCIRRSTRGAGAYARRPGDGPNPDADNGRRNAFA
jgi:hypothetical protein